MIQNSLSNKILEFINNFPRITDFEHILNYIVEKLIHILNCDGGSIYLLEDNKLIFKVAKNITLEKYQNEKFKKIIKEFYLPVDNTSIAGYVANNNKELIINDFRQLYENYGITYNKEFDEYFNYKTHNMLTLPITGKNNHVIGVIQLINAKSFNDSKQYRDFTSEDLELLHNLKGIIGINLENSILHKKLFSSYTASLFRLGVISEYRDKETGNHVKRVGLYSKYIAEKLGLDQNFCEFMELTAPMHDIGKIGISDTILLKERRFTDEEREIMKFHTIIGAEIFKDSSSELDFFAQIIALTHHEKYDGSGYPLGLKGEEIPLPGRIVALADVFDALISKRVYKDAWDLQKIIDLIKQEKGKHFDPKIAEIFLENTKKFIEIYNELSQDDDLGYKDCGETVSFKTDTSDITIYYLKYTKEYVYSILKNNPLTSQYSALNF